MSSSHACEGGSPGSDPLPSDVASLLRGFRAQAQRRGLCVVELGRVGPFPVLLLEPDHPVAGAPCLLLAAGFHGDEPAGCWGLLELLRGAPEELFHKANLSFLPVVNPTGLAVGRRGNDQGENPNRGYCPPCDDQAEPSREGRILLEHLPHLLEAGRLGFLSLHEDGEREQFYLYTYEQGEAPGAFTEALRQAEEAFFPCLPDGEVAGSPVRHGVIFRECDGSFEDLLFHDGVPVAAVTETPGRRDFATRVRANRAIAEAFVRYLAEGARSGVGPTDRPRP
ncbi:MAG: M14 family metallocarboxypeptidase [Pseudomonadota bacterium]